jgi:DHA1 family inner membrane transport protein
VLARFLAADEHPEVRSSLGLITLARLSTNAIYRFAPPFLPAIGRGLGVDLAVMGTALGVSELSGLASPALGRMAERRSRQRAMVVGLTIVALAGLAAAASPGVAAFTVALIVVALAKTTFDVSAYGWIGDRVPVQRRARAMGLIETSWAGGLLVGVSALGLILAVTNWRVAYMVGAVAVGVAALAVARRVPLDPAPGAARRDHEAEPPARLSRQAWRVIAALTLLMSGSQAVFVTFGAWLEDDFGFASAAVAAVSFGLGVVELGASASTVRFTDRIGPPLAVLGGGLLMVPAGLALGSVGSAAWLGVPVFVAYIAAFEFALVSALPLVSELQPAARVKAMGVAFGCGTLGRAVTSAPTAWLYERHGMGASGALGAVFAVGVVVAVVPLVRLSRSAPSRPTLGA